MKLAIINTEGVIVQITETNLTSEADLHLVHVGDHVKKLLDDDHTYQEGDVFKGSEKPVEYIPV